MTYDQSGPQWSFTPPPPSPPPPPPYAPPPQYGQQQQFYAPPPQPIIINNSASSSASAAAAAGVWGVRGARRRQSAMTHLVLFLFTAGIGNVIYAMYINSWNRRHASW